MSILDGAEDGGGGGDERRAGSSDGLAGLHVVLGEAGAGGVALGAHVLLTSRESRRAVRRQFGSRKRFALRLKR